MGTSRILVIGAAGAVGSELVRLLVSAGRQPTVLAYNNADAWPLHPGVRLVTGDLRYPESLCEAFCDIEKVFVATTGPDILRLESNVYVAARTADVRHVLKLSSRVPAFETGPRTPLVLAHLESENRLFASGVAWTVIRAGMLSSNFLSWIDPVNRVVALPAGSGCDTPTDPRDVAEFAASVLMKGDHDQKLYEVTGPDALAYEQMVRIISMVTGQPLVFVDITSEVLAGGLRTAGMPESVVASILGYFEAVRSSKIGPPTATFMEIMGRSARTFIDWARSESTALGGLHAVGRR